MRMILVLATELNHANYVLCNSTSGSQIIIKGPLNLQVKESFSTPCNYQVLINALKSKESIELFEGIPLSESHPMDLK